MKYYTIKPRQRLKEFVSHFWISEFDGSEGNSFTYLSTADSCAKLVFPYTINNETAALSGLKLFSCVLQGQTQQHFKSPTQGSFGMFGAYLFPYAIRQLFSMPASELSDTIVDLKTLLGQTGKDLDEKMAAAHHNAHRVEIISDFFEEMLTANYFRETAITSAIHHVRDQAGLVNIRELSEQYFLSQKQFERKFREHSGFMPKLYARIVRFESALTGYNKRRSLTEVGYESGYYDQSHFIHDFKKFSGHHPKSYFASIPELA